MDIPADLSSFKEFEKLVKAQKKGPLATIAHRAGLGAKTVLGRKDVATLASEIIQYHCKSNAR